MERAIMGLLVGWKDRGKRQPMLIRGVRQCGKTWVMKTFGQLHFKDVAYYNFEGNEPLLNRFEQDLDVQRIITELGVLRGRAIEPGHTLVIFDEIQFSNRALSALKYFAENMPELHVLCAGSLLGVALAKPLSFPVGKVEMLTMHPLNFHEFLLANGDAELSNALSGRQLGSVVSPLYAPRLEALFRQYLLTGGMPEVVSSWIQKQDIAEVEVIQQKILDSYMLDFAKHAPDRDFPRLSLIWQSIPVQLARENSKFMFSRVKQGLRAKDLEDALEWLISAGLAYRVARIEKPAMPLAAYADHTHFKLYLCDVGLLRRMARLPAEAILGEVEAYKEFKGALVENHVLCEIMSQHDQEPFFWKSGNTAEVDYVIQLGSDIVPIEVKAAENLRARSLSTYRAMYNPPRSIIVSLSPKIGRKDGLEHVPLYLMWRLFGRET